MCNTAHAAAVAKASLDHLDGPDAHLDGPGAYGGPADERIATPAEHGKLHAAGFRETMIQTLWIAPPSYGGRFLSVDEALAELARVEEINAGEAV